MNQARSSVFGDSLEPAGVKLTAGGNKQTKQQHVQYNKPMKKLTMLLALGATVALMPSVSKAAIAGGSHDFSSGTNGYATYTWGGSSTTYVNPCQICHIPHKAPDAAISGGPLWNHKQSANSSYITYDQGNSATFNALGLTATLGSSVACLSCHDGSVAVNQSYTGKYPSANGSSTSNSVAFYAPTFAIETMQPGTEPASSGAFVSATGSGPYLNRNDLTHMHPIGISYTAAIKVAPTLQPVPAAGTVFAQMLKGPNKTVECASCHDIHGTIGASATVSHSLIVDVNNAALCETCHQQ